MHSSHDLPSALQLSPSTPMLLIFLLILFCALLWTFLPKQIKKLGFTTGSTELAVDENLPDFFNAIKNQDKSWFLEENKRMKE